MRQVVATGTILPSVTRVWHDEGMERLENDWPAPVLEEEDEWTAWVPPWWLIAAVTTPLAVFVQGWLQGWWL